MGTKLNGHVYCPYRGWRLQLWMNLSGKEICSMHIYHVKERDQLPCQRKGPVIMSKKGISLMVYPDFVNGWNASRITLRVWSLEFEVLASGHWNSLKKKLGWERNPALPFRTFKKELKRTSGKRISYFSTSPEKHKGPAMLYRFSYNYATCYEICYVRLV
jgi:hypothetical protein